MFAALAHISTSSAAQIRIVNISFKLKLTPGVTIKTEKYLSSASHKYFCGLDRSLLNSNSASFLFNWGIIKHPLGKTDFFAFCFKQLRHLLLQKPRLAWRQIKVVGNDWRQFPFAVFEYTVFFCFVGVVRHILRKLYDTFHFFVCILFLQKLVELVKF